jgi:hypothetical protein
MNESQVYLQKPESNELANTAIDHLEAELNRLRQSILSAAFAGKLVPKGAEAASRMLS